MRASFSRAISPANEGDDADVPSKVARVPWKKYRKLVACAETSGMA
jgi:hypothetical protein